MRLHFSSRFEPRFNFPLGFSAAGIKLFWVSKEVARLGERSRRWVGGHGAHLIPMNASKMHLPESLCSVYFTKMENFTGYPSNVILQLFWQVKQFPSSPWSIECGGRFPVWLLRFFYRMWYDPGHTLLCIPERLWKSPGYCKVTRKNMRKDHKEIEIPKKSYFFQALPSPSELRPQIPKWRNLGGP